MKFFLAFLLPVTAIADQQCWGSYDPKEKEECQYEFLSEEDAKIDQWIRNNLTAFWTRDKK